MSTDSPAATPGAPAHVPCWHSYRPLPGYHDEMLGKGDSPRPHWAPVLGQIDALSLPKLAEQWSELRGRAQEGGPASGWLPPHLERPTAAAHSPDRPWPLDPIPLVIGSDEAAAIEAGLVQRARLLELILADLYGPQKLLTGGLLPAEIVLGHPGFLRPCHRVNVPGGRRLCLYAADIGRGPDGSPAVIADRTESPSGVGYALQNRIILSRLLPDAFQECRVQRLALFFHTLRESVRALAPQNKDNPRVVLLSAGPQSKTYFGDAYLSRYLGYTLAEGGDLTVRDNHLYLKLLAGLQPVEVVFRRVPADMCDPLELRRDSTIGVPGLMHAVRTGNVAVAGSLGCGLAESPALLPFLPALCRHLLGEDLLLPSVPAWWCGDRQARDHVLANLPRLVIKPAYGSPDLDPIFGPRLTPDEQAELADRIRARPNEFVGQELLHLSTAPALSGDRLRPRHIVLRCFLTIKGDGFAVMPGGLTRVSPAENDLELTPARGSSKDTWVIASGPVSQFSLLRPAVHAIELTRAGNDLPSRAADNLFWLGRYAARADSMVRLLRVILVRLTESSGVRDVPELPALLAALVQQTGALPARQPHPAGKWQLPPGELQALIFDPRRPGSLAATLQSLHQTAGLSRDRISDDMWRILAGLELDGGGQRGLPPRLRNGAGPHHGPAGLHRNPSDVLDAFGRMVVHLAAFGGLASESMTRGQGWRFLDLGRRIECSLQLVGLLRSTLVTTGDAEPALLEAVLETLDSSMTYRRRYLGGAEAGPVLDLLLADEDNPRSLSHQLAGLSRQVEQLPRDQVEARRPPEERIVLGLLTAVRLAQIEDLAAPGEGGTRAALDDLLGLLEEDLPRLSDAISRSYLAHLKPARQLANIQPRS